MIQAPTAGAQAAPAKTARRGKSKKSLELIQAAHDIARAAQPITVRGVAYKLFTLGLISSMAKKETGRVSKQLTDAREAGTIPWKWIVDETREAERINQWSSPSEIIEAAVVGYRRDYWSEQSRWVEVWSEKGTVRGVLKPVLDQFGVTFRVMHGFGSATAVHDIASETRRADRDMTVLYVGDWDPSGLYMSERDLPERLVRYGGQCCIHRVALAEDDIGPGTRLPSFDAETKSADPRSRWFAERYGNRCWELDAMDPGVLRDRVRRRIEALIDREAWDHATEIEAAEIESMKLFHEQWRRSISGQDSICEVQP